MPVVLPWCVSLSLALANSHELRTRESFTRNSCLFRFRGEGGDDFFEARIAAQGVPPRVQFQLAIGELARTPDGDGKLFAGEIVIANPRSNSSQTHDHALAIGRFCFPWKKNRPMASA